MAKEWTVYVSDPICSRGKIHLVNNNIKGHLWSNNQKVDDKEMIKRHFRSGEGLPKL